MEKFINAIVFDDGYHDKFVICKGDIHKYSFCLFVNKIAICHDETYIFKTIHYEDLDEESNVAEAFEVSTVSFTTCLPCFISFISFLRSCILCLC